MSESNVNTPPAPAASANGLGYGPIKPLAVSLSSCVCKRAVSRG